MNSLANLNQYYIPNTLDGINTITQEVSSNALLVDGSNKMLADLDMNSHQIKNVANGTNADDAVNKSQLDLKADTTYVDTNFLNKVTTTSQNVASRLTFNNTTSGQAYPIIELQNAITGSNNGMYLRFFKNFNRLPNTEIGSIVFADKAATSNVTSRAVQLTASIDSVSNPLLNITFDSGNFNPLTISNTQTILRNNDFYIKNKTTAENLLTYFNSSDKFTMYKPLDMNTTNKIINIAEPTNNQDVASKFYVDSHSANNNYLLRNGTLPMTGNLQMGSYKITNLLEPDDLNDGATKFYCDTQSANTHYLLRNGTLAMTGNLNLATHNLITSGTIDCNIIDANGDIVTTSNMSCTDFNSAGNQVIGGSSLNVLDVKSSAFFEANVLIETNKHLAFNSGDLSTTNGMLMNHTGSVGFLDMRGTEFRIRTASAGAPNTIRFKVNDTNTTVINNFFVDANTTLGSNALLDTLTMKAQANFPNDSKLTFNSGSELLFQTGVPVTFNNTLNFLSGSYIDGARVRLINSGNTSYTMNNDNIENGVLCTNTSTISITMPAKSAYWNNRSYYIKTQTADVNLVQNTGTSIDNDNTTLGMTSNYRGYHLYFDSDYANNGKIWRLTQI
jgi:hypothetical protein